MAPRSFRIVYAPEVSKHFDYIDRKYWNLIREKIEEQLLYSPDKETRNRKPLRKPPIPNRWEIRFGPTNTFRVFYEIDIEKHTVRVLAIGYKENERLYIGGKEII